jgi:hypothetical protein
MRARSDPSCRALRGYCGVALLSGMVALAPTSIRAETRIEGPADSVRLQLRDASVQEAIEALGARYDLRLRTETPLDRRISGDLAGPLARVLSRLLDRYDYVVRSADGALDVVVLGNRRGQAAVGGFATSRAQAAAPRAGDFVPVTPAAAPPGPKRQLVSIDPPETPVVPRPPGQLVSVDPPEVPVPPVPPDRLVSVDPPANAAAAPRGPVGPIDFDAPAAAGASAGSHQGNAHPSR